MYIYILNLAFISIIGAVIFNNGINKSKNKVFLIMSSIAMILISSLRDTKVGFDTENYISYFNEISKIPLTNIFKFPLEKGYVFLNKIISYISIDSRVFFFIISAFIIYSFSRFIYKNSKNVFLSVILFLCLGFFGDSLNITRQMIAISIILYAYEYIKIDKYFNAILITLLAISFHKTAIVFFIYIIVSKYKITNKYIITYFIMSVIILFIGKPLINIINNIFYSDKYSSFVVGEGINLFLLYLSINIFGVLLINKVLKKDRLMFFEYHGIFLQTIFQALCIYFSLFSRTVRYFSIFNIIFIPNIISSIENKSLRILIYYLVILASLLLYYLSIETHGIMPYVFFKT